MGSFLMLCVYRLIIIIKKDSISTILLDLISLWENSSDRILRLGGGLSKSIL